jgi:hypothetical protein
MIIVKNRRLGKFYITGDYLDGFNPNVQQIMGQCVILRSEYMIHMDAIEYIAVSDKFDELEEGRKPPEYTWIIDEGILSWKKV